MKLSIMLKHFSNVSKIFRELNQNVDDMAKNIEEVRYNNEVSKKIILKSIKKLRKCFGGIKIEKIDFTTKGCIMGSTILICDKYEKFLTEQESEDILLAGPSIAKDFLLDILKDDVKFKRKLKLKKINENSFKNS